MKLSSKSTVLLALLYVAVFVRPATSQDWTQFRGPQFGKHSGAALQTAWTSEDIGWKTELPGPGASSPVTFGKRVYLTCYTGYGIDRGNPGNPTKLERHVICINLDDGSTVWKKTIGPKSAKNQYTPWAVALHGYASSTPAVDESGVYAFLGDSGCVALDHDGKTRWTFDCGTSTHMFGSGASPVLYKELVIINATPESGDLIAVNKSTGKEVWRTGGINESWGTPAVYPSAKGSFELALSMKGKVVAYDPADGTPLWKCSGIRGYVCPSVVVSDGVIFSIGGKNTKKAVAVRSGGTDDVSETHLQWELSKGSNVGSPVIHEGHVYWAREDGIVYCVDIESGKVAYEKRLEPKSGLIYASPLLSNGNLYYVSRENGTYVIAAKPEFQLIAHNIIEGDDGVFNASPVPTSTGLLLRSDRFLYLVKSRAKDN